LSTFNVKQNLHKSSFNRSITSAQNVVPAHTHALSRLRRCLDPLVDSRVNDSLLQIIPQFSESLLQLIDVTYTTFDLGIYTLLRDSPDLVVDGVQIWTVWRPEVRTDEVRCLRLQQLDGDAGAMCRSAAMRTTSFDTLELEIAMNYSVHSQSVNASFTYDLTNRLVRFD